MSRHLLILANEAIKAKAKRWIDGVPFGTRVEFREERRSTAQNDRMWAMLGDISKQVHHNGRVYNNDRWKVIFLYALGQETEFLPSLDGMSFIPYGPRSSELSVAEMSELISLMEAWGAEHGVVFHDPPETKRGADGNAAGPIEPGTNPAALQSNQPNLIKEIRK